jgi:hypothetical protein
MLSDSKLPPAFMSADFALQMVEGVEKVIFIADPTTL